MSTRNMQQLYVNVVNSSNVAKVKFVNLSTNEDANVNLRQWTDIVTYIEDITSPVNVPSSMDRLKSVNERFDS